MKFFKNIETLDAAKKEFRRWCMELHPDRGGNAADFVAMQKEYRNVLENLKAGKQATDKDVAYETAAVERYAAVIKALAGLAGLDIHLAGTWLWIGGNTREHRAELKKAGCRWAPKKGLWYYRDGRCRCSRGRGSTPMNKIRTKYGWKKVKGQGGDVVKKEDKEN